MDGQINAHEIVSYVNEFYSNVGQERRQQLDRILCQFKLVFSCEETISMCIHMMDRSNSSHVQYFGAISLYETVRERSEGCIANQTLMENLKTFLVNNLTASSRVQMQSVTNKLSSTLALLALYSIPDVWPQPVQDLTNKWAATPELLLRVLTEVAAEFSNIKMPLTQRSILKTELHRISEDIINIITIVMGAPDASPSTRQAAVECVEQWIQLPGVGLQQWTNVLSVVFVAVSEDNAALTNMLNILATNDELGTLEQLVLDICSYITRVASHKIASELREEGDSEEAVSLVAAVCTLAERAVPTLIRYARLNKSTHLEEICQLFATLSGWGGNYPVDECISDLPSVFWTTLRECLMEDRAQAVISSVSEYYANVLASSVTKLSFPSPATFDSMDHEKRDQFLAYRLNRSEVSIDAYYIAGGNATLNFLNQTLEETVASRDVCKAEAVLYLWYLVADYLSEENYDPICKCLELCSQFSETSGTPHSNMLLCSMMKVLDNLSHLIQDHPNAIDLETHALRLIVSAMNNPNVIEEALMALEKFAESRSDCLMAVGEHISERCFSCFMNERNSVSVRMRALKCIGYFLSLKPSGTIIDIVNRMISPHVNSLTATDCITQKEEETLFQIQIFSCLFSTLHNKKSASTDDSVIVHIFEQAIPVFRKLLSDQGSCRTIGDKVCEAIRAAIGNLSPADLMKVFPFVSEVIETSLFSNSVASCSLAKSCVLVYSDIRELSSNLCTVIAQWFLVFEKNISHGEIEEWLGLEYHVVKKNWKLLKMNEDQLCIAISSAISLCGNLLLTSQEPSCVKLAAQILATLTSQTTSYGDEKPKQLLATNGPQLVKTIFARIQSEIARNTVELLAESLQFFVRFYSQETREVINAEGHGDSPIIAAMFREAGNLRNFKQMTIRLNQACRNCISIPLS